MLGNGDLLDEEIMMDIDRYDSDELANITVLSVVVLHTYTSMHALAHAY